MLTKEKILLILSLWVLMGALVSSVWMDKYYQMKQELERLKKLR